MWLQLARLTRQAVAARLRRGARALGQVAYGLCCWVVFLLVSAVGLPALMLLSAPRARLRLAHGAAKPNA